MLEWLLMISYSLLFYFSSAFSKVKIEIITWGDKKIQLATDDKDRVWHPLYANTMKS